MGALEREPLRQMGELEEGADDILALPNVGASVGASAEACVGACVGSSGV